MTAIQPVSADERVRFMDALRGFAVLGIFIANLGAGFSFWQPGSVKTGPWLSSYDDQVFFLHHVFIEGKFYSIFSLLFGWGIALQIMRIRAKGIERISLVRRRLLVMILLGFTHLILLWTGDIVLFYGLLGFILLWVRNWSDKKLLITGSLLVLSPILLYFFKMKFPVLNEPAGLLYSTGGKVGAALSNINSNEDFFMKIQTGNYFELIKLNAAGFFFRYGYLFFVSRIPKVLGMFMIGFALGRNGNYKRVLENPKLLWTIFAAGFLIGLPANYFLAEYMKDPGSYYGLTIKGWHETIVYAIGVAPLALSYAAGLALLFRTTAGKKILSVFQPVGKMAFSNYIFQSLVGVFTFYGIGFGVFDKMGALYFTLFGIMIFTGQIILSRIWLTYFEFGPVEWLWRSFTYNKRQRFRKMSSKDLSVD